LVEFYEFAVRFFLILEKEFGMSFYFRKKLFCQEIPGFWVRDLIPGMASREGPFPGPPTEHISGTGVV